MFITVLKTIIFLYNGHFFYLLSIFGTTKKDSSQLFGQNQSFYLDKLLNWLTNWSVTWENTLHKLKVTFLYKPLTQFLIQNEFVGSQTYRKVNPSCQPQLHNFLSAPTREQIKSRKYLWKIVIPLTLVTILFRLVYKALSFYEFV